MSELRKAHRLNVAPLGLYAMFWFSRKRLSGS